MAELKNNGKIKLMIIVGIRPENIRLATVIKKSANSSAQYLSTQAKTMTKK